MTNEELQKDLLEIWRTVHKTLQTTSLERQETAQHLVVALAQISAAMSTLDGDYTEGESR